MIRLICVPQCEHQVLYHSAGDDHVLPSQCVSLYPPEVGSPPGFRRYVRNCHPQALQVLWTQIIWMKDHMRNDISSLPSLI